MDKQTLLGENPAKKSRRRILAAAVVIAAAAGGAAWWHFGSGAAKPSYATQALTTGNRTIMMDSGNIIIDLDSQKREGMTVTDLLNLYKSKENKEFDNDRMLLQK